MTDLERVEEAARTMASLYRNPEWLTFADLLLKAQLEKEPEGGACEMADRKSRALSSGNINTENEP